MAYEDGSLSVSTDGKSDSRDSLLVLVPHERLHDMVRIIKESCKAKKPATATRTADNAVPLITQGIIGAKCAATQMSCHTWPRKPALLNRQEMEAHPEIDIAI